MKKDVYEHLAKTFLDKKVKKKNNNKLPAVISAVALCFIFLAILVLVAFTGKGGVFSRNLFVVQDRVPIEIGYNFSSTGDTKIQALSYDLKGIDLSEYDYLSLSIRTKEKDNIDSSIKVKIKNLLQEEDANYLSGINAKWKVFTIPLKEFKYIKDWSSIAELTFVVEEWNVGKKINKIYIDDVKFVSEKNKD